MSYFIGLLSFALQLLLCEFCDTGCPVPFQYERNCAQSVLNSKSVAIFRWLLSEGVKIPRLFTEQYKFYNIAIEISDLLRNFFWPSQSQICKLYNDFFVSFRSSLLSWISAKNVKNLDILHPHAHHQPLKIENSTIFSLYLR